MRIIACFSVQGWLKYKASLVAKCTTGNTAFHKPRDRLSSPISHKANHNDRRNRNPLFLVRPRWVQGHQPERDSELRLRHKLFGLRFDGGRESTDTFGLADRALLRTCLPINLVCRDRSLVRVAYAHST